MIIKQRITKKEQFLKELIYAGRIGIKPVDLAQRINTTCITKYPYDFSLIGVYVSVGAYYRFSNKHDATNALAVLNQYRTKRGDFLLPVDLLEEWN